MRGRIPETKGWWWQDDVRGSGHDWPWLITFPILRTEDSALTSAQSQGNQRLFSSETRWSTVGLKNPLRRRGIMPRSQSKCRSGQGDCQLDTLHILIFRFPARRMAPPPTAPCCPSKTAPPLLETLSSTGPSRKYQIRLIKIYLEIYWHFKKSFNSHSIHRLGTEDILLSCFIRWTGLLSAPLRLWSSLTCLRSSRWSVS